VAVSAGRSSPLLARLAAHGCHDRDSVLFSRLDLADGPLMAYDLHTPRTPPRQVIISACDVGRTVVRPGEEVLGFTAALLYLGASTAVPSVARAAADAAGGLMNTYRRALTSGAGPAEALAQVSGTGTLSPSVCSGSG